MDKVSETVREPWRVVLEMNVYEFLNIVCYTRDKAEFEKMRVNNFIKKH